MKLLEVGATLTEETIQEFEREIKIKLPQDYKDFLINSNGGTPDGTWVFDFFDIGNSCENSTAIDFFEKIYTGDSNTIENDNIKARYKALVDTEQIPINLLPIADDTYGNIIFICIAGTDFGKVFFGDHELEVPGTGYLVMSLIADSFSSFLEKLYLDDEE